MKINFKFKVYGVFDFTNQIYRTGLFSEPCSCTKANYKLHICFSCTHLFRTLLHSDPNLNSLFQNYQNSDQFLKQNLSQANLPLNISIKLNSLTITDILLVPIHQTTCSLVSDWRTNQQSVLSSTMKSIKN